MKNPTIVAVLFGMSFLMPTSICQPDSPLQQPKTRFETEIFHAVLEGLYDDGVDNETLDLILMKDEVGDFRHFVRGCPICTYVLEAMRHYRARPEFVSFKTGGNTWGPGLTKQDRERFASPQMKVRLDGIQILVQRWLDKRMDRLRLNKRERAAWALEMKKRAKKGMEMLAVLRQAGASEQWQDFDCPSCVGAIDGAGGNR
tara:strand:+ start:34605 stop:35207 length:603 start_codon:yes stop_codon:yes gene_type:complete